jgi:hypothetical protein
MGCGGLEDLFGGCFSGGQVGGCHCLRWCMLLIEGENGVNYWSWDRRAVLVGVYCVEVVNLGFRLLAEYFESNVKISLFSTPTECISL